MKLAPTPYNIYDLDTGQFIAGIFHEINLRAELRWLARQGRRVEVVDHDEHLRRTLRQAEKS